MTLQSADGKTLYTVHDTIPRPDSVHTVTLPGFIFDTSGQTLPFPLTVKLLSESVIVEDAYLSVIEL